MCFFPVLELPQENMEQTEVACLVLEEDSANTQLKFKRLLNYCRSPDFKSPIGPTKNLKRHYNRVVGCLVGCLVGRLQRWL